jgi:DNA-directed RNA polymerase specialized sigma24 family protein
LVILQNPLLSNATLSEFYRFALLLTGNLKMAEQIMAETLHEVEGRLEELRHESHRHTWLATNIRQRCLRENAGNMHEIPRLLRDDQPQGECGEVLEIEAFIVAQRFSTLPEPERSALALFYLDLFTAEEIAKLLKMELEELGELLVRGRNLLENAMQPSA